MSLKALFLLPFLAPCASLLLGRQGCFLKRRVSLKRKKKDQWTYRNWSLEVIKGTFSDTVSCSMRTLYRLVDRGVFSKEEFPWQGKRKINGHTEIGVWMSLKALFLLPFLAPCASLLLGRQGCFLKRRVSFDKWRFKKF